MFAGEIVDIDMLDDRRDQEGWSRRDAQAKSRHACFFVAQVVYDVVG